MKRRQSVDRPAKAKTSDLRRLTQSVGKAPGALSIDPDWPPPSLRLMAYGPESFIEDEIQVDEISEYLGAWPTVWVNVAGLGDAATLARLGELFSLHRLALEDVVNLGQRAKAEAYDEDLFIVARTPNRTSAPGEQLTVLLGQGFVLSFLERPGTIFENVRERIRHGKGKIRKSGPDYLAYALLDAVIDSYFPLLEEFSESVVELEHEVLGSPDQVTVSKIYDVKRRLLEVRRTLSPHREALNSLIREAGNFISDETALYLRDTYDHTLRIVEMVESQRDLCSDLMATYLSVVSNRMNEVMKVLSIIGTVFIPLGFIAGLYGMNFDRGASPYNMPELGWYLGYPFALLIMGSTAVGLLLYFWRKGWFK
jgi:magnesium transporter